MVPVTGAIAQSMLGTTASTTWARNCSTRGLSIRQIRKMPSRQRHHDPDQQAAQGAGIVIAL